MAREKAVRLRHVHTAVCFLFFALVSLFRCALSLLSGNVRGRSTIKSLMLHIVGGGERTAAIVGERKLKLLTLVTWYGLVAGVVGVLTSYLLTVSEVPYFFLAGAPYISPKR